MNLIHITNSNCVEYKSILRGSQPYGTMACSVRFFFIFKNSLLVIVHVHTGMKKDDQL